MTSTSCRRSRRRPRRFLIPSSTLHLLILVIVTTEQQQRRAHAFHERHVSIDERDLQKEFVTRLRRQRGSYLENSLRSIARVAERGASRWGDYVSGKEATTSKNRYVNDGLELILSTRSDPSVLSRFIRRGDDEVSRVPTSTERLTREVLAAAVGGITFGSAFPLATGCAFLATAMVALGAVTTAFFTKGDGVGEIELDGEPDRELLATSFLPSDDDKRTSAIGEGCDYYADDYENESLPVKEDLPSWLLDNVTLDELKRCYNGDEKHLSLLEFVDSRASILICDVDEVGLSSTIDYPMTYGEVELVEPSTSVNVSLKSPTVVEDDTTPKRVEVAWHDAALSGISDVHYFTRIVKSCEGSELWSTNDRRWIALANVERERRSRTALYAAIAAMSGRGGLDESDVLTGAIEDACMFTGDCDRVKPTVVEDATYPKKRVELVWPMARGPLPEVGDVRRIALTDGERDGALLLGESFRVVSSMFGLAADAVRFTGETTAATAGGVSRLAVGVVKVTGWAVGSLGEAIENGSAGRRRNGSIKVQDKKGNQVRKIAGTSMRLFAGAIEQLGDSLLLAGSAVEHITFAAAEVAEGTVRILENSSSSLSDMFAREGMKGTNVIIPRPKMVIGQVPSVIYDESRPEVTGIVTSEDTNTLRTESNNDRPFETDASGIDEVMNFIRPWILRNAEIIAADTGGVSSLAYEMLGVFLLCLLASLVLLSSKENDTDSLNTSKLLSSKRSNDDGVGRPKNITFDSRCENVANNHASDDHDSHSTLTVDSTVQAGPDIGTKNCVSAYFHFLLLLPVRLVRAFILSWNIVFSKGAVLFVIHIVGWIYLSWVAQYKSSVIQRQSEIMGYKLAVESMGEISPSIKESAVWLNSILSTAWRVGSGGLETRVSSSLRKIFAESLSRPYSKPSAVAHVALNAFTFGSSPPIISRIELTGVDREKSVIFMNVDVGMLLQDAILLLDIKPSALEYKSLPSTKVSINSLDAKATLDVSVLCSPIYPYISFVNISLVEIPAFSLRIEPQSGSGLKGVDFGSFPIVSSWIKSSINAALSGYLSPQYISIDVLAWLNGDETIANKFEH